MHNVDVNQMGADSQDFYVSGTGIGSELLAKIKKVKPNAQEQVVYGVYNNADKGVFTKINDFLIDHAKVDLKDKSYFFHMLAVMVDSGIPVVGAVKSLASRSKNLRFRRVLNTIAYNCEHGSTLSDAMSRFEDVFDESELGIVKSGEATGKLHNMLFKLSDQLDKRHDLYLKLWGAAVYPIAVFVVLILVAGGMLIWIFPTLLSLLQEGGVEAANLPFATKLLVNLEHAVTGFWWLILLVLFLAYGLFEMYVRSDSGAVRWDYTKLGMPIIGGLLRKVYVLRFIALIGILVDSGLSIIDSLRITGNAISNKVYRLKVQEVIDSVKDGGKISDSLRDSEYLFPAEIIEMIAVGEASASVAKVCEKVGDQYQREIDNSLKKLTSIFEPAMILVVGLFVALLALAIMAPIFNLSTTIG